MNSIGLSPATLVPFLAALSFAAGLNLYATAGTLGILGHMGWIPLPHGLEILGHPWVIAASAVLFACEMFADKIPYIDLVWNFAHTFIRIPVAALMAYRASTALPPVQQALVVLLSGIIAAVAHGSKTAARTLVTASPEPVSNIVLSSGEDFAAIGLTWLATRHPYAAGTSAVVLVVAAILAIRWIVRRLRLELTRLRTRWGGASRLTPTP